MTKERATSSVTNNNNNTSKTQVTGERAEEASKYESRCMPDRNGSMAEKGSGRSVCDASWLPLASLPGLALGFCSGYVGALTSTRQDGKSSKP